MPWQPSPAWGAQPRPVLPPPRGRAEGTKEGLQAVSGRAKRLQPPGHGAALAHRKRPEPARFGAAGLSRANVCRGLPWLRRPACWLRSPVSGPLCSALLRRHRPTARPAFNLPSSTGSPSGKGEGRERPLGSGSGSRCVWCALDPAVTGEPRLEGARRSGEEAARGQTPLAAPPSPAPPRLQQGFFSGSGPSRFTRKPRPGGRFWPASAPGSSAGRPLGCGGVPAQGHAWERKGTAQPPCGLEEEEVPAPPRPAPPGEGVWRALLHRTGSRQASTPHPHPHPLETCAGDGRRLVLRWAHTELLSSSRDQRQGRGGGGALGAGQDTRRESSKGSPA